ncbi:hypothetical protein NUU61_008345 [Penicillium alfredii]|uniref:Uncharacterized protein n=1 Tax=Penicillium alfredii TaxID=1506179 RepID=A0A9W9ES65_9EURO|nr:uncharacterized protein NUU61_008345 [Penicillium alfredii]KAJ5087038.1 hypothetical protein NUU61_008345 [Penicillium alfredii]
MSNIGTSLGSPISSGNDSVDLKFLCWLSFKIAQKLVYNMLPSVPRFRKLHYRHQISDLTRFLEPMAQ